MCKAYRLNDVSWDEPNSNLGRPKLSYDRLLGQTSSLKRVELINRVRPKSKFMISNKFSPERG